jgi:hypothetical protein
MAPDSFRISWAHSGTAHFPKLSGACPSRCPFMSQQLSNAPRSPAHGYTAMSMRPALPVANVKYRSHGTIAHCTRFPESLTRNLYRKKIPEMTLNVP